METGVVPIQALASRRALQEEVHAPFHDMDLHVVSVRLQGLCRAAQEGFASDRVQLGQKNSRRPLLDHRVGGIREEKALRAQQAFHDLLKRARERRRGITST